MVEALSRVQTPRFVAGLSTQGAARLVGFAVMAITAPLVARHLGPDGYGQLTIVITVLFFLNMVGEFGLPLLAAREWPQITSADERRLWLGSFWDLRHLVTALTIALGLGVALFAPFPTTVRIGVMIGLIGLVATLTAGTAGALFTAEMDPASPAFFELATRLTWLVAALVALALDQAVLGVVGALAVSQVAGSALLIWLARRKALAWPFHARRVPRRLVRLARQALPLAPLPILGVMYARVDTLILAVQASPAEVGVYGAIWRILELLMALVAVVSGFLLPVFVNCRNREEQKLFYQRSLRLLAIGMIPAAVFVGFLAGPALLFIGGSEFVEPTITAAGIVWPEAALAMVMGAFALMSIGNVNGTVMLARKLHPQLVRHFLLAIGANVVLALFLIPRFSYLGAAAASLGSEAVAVVHSTWIARRNLGPLALGSALMWPLAAGAGVAGGLMVPIPLVGRMTLAGLLAGWISWIAVGDDLRALLARGKTRDGPEWSIRYLGRLLRRLDRQGPLEPHNRRAYAVWLLRDTIRDGYYRKRARRAGSPWPPNPDSVAGPKVNIGSGNDHREEWINLDLRPVGDLVAEVTALPFRDGSIDYVLANDLLEHFWGEQIQSLLAEWRRVLGRDGWLELRVPNLLYLGRLLQTNKDLTPFIENIYGGHRWGERGELDTHHWGWTPDTLERELAQAGFTVVTNDHAPNMTVKALRQSKSSAGSAS
ncbi:MAG: oligosaccharide flippase family protein [Actinomycetota bacterium]|nr:oligosaccharide flippase family protein [Actinomycetota bacterium]